MFPATLNVFLVLLGSLAPRSGAGRSSWRGKELREPDEVVGDESGGEERPDLGQPPQLDLSEPTDALALAEDFLDARLDTDI